jgi:AmmeMemoRadiSam system protein B/AmmeMemoRadiSam system protein A
MKNSFTRWVLVLVVIAICPACHSADASKERPAAVAGSFYPADAAQLTACVDGNLSRVSVPAPAGPVIAIVAPHAGYEYSGSVAAHSYALLKGKKFKRVVVIGPSHFEGIGYSSVYDGAAYTTPLGKILVDREFARKLAGSDRTIRLSSAGHEIHQQSEHSIEVQLPFLQRVLGDFTVVPVVMGNQSYEASRALGIALAKLLRNSDDTLLVASSDLSHYHSYADATRMDGNLLNAIVQDDFLTVSRNTETRVWEACGAGPVVAVMIASERLGGGAPQLLKYANSGDITGDKSRVVGYGAIAILRAGNSPQELKFTLSDSERAELLRIARVSVETAVREHKPYQPDTPSSVSLLQERGVFVTLKEHGELRGCIGYSSPIYPLYMAVRDVAAYAALRDPRFPPVKLEELPKLEYEISVLSPFRHVLKTDTVRVGEDGLLVRRGGREGLLLPQVPVEQRWNRQTFLEQASEKAELPSDAWQDPATDIFTFRAIVFSDHDVNRAREKH